MVLHVRFKSRYISFPSSTEQQREMTKFYGFWKTRIAVPNFSYLLLAGIERCWVHVQPEQVFRLQGALNRLTECDIRR